MSTRGFFGWRKDGEIHGVYIHSDAYPSYTGARVLKCLLGLSNKEMARFVKSSIKFSSIRSQDLVWKILEADWRHPNRTYKDADYAVFLKDGVFMEHGYVIDLDAKKPTLLVFCGFGEKPSKGWEHLTEKPDESGSSGLEQYWVSFGGKIDLSLPYEQAYLLLYGMSSQCKELKSRCLALAKMSDGQVIAECTYPEKYATNPDSEFSIKEAKDMLDAYLKWRMTKAA